jgi:hypothetical protein
MAVDENLMQSSVWKYAVNRSRKKTGTVNTMDEFRETTLKGHVEKCQLRYEHLNQKLEAMDARLTKVEADISAIKGATQAGFADIKLLLEKQSNARTIQLIATIGTITAAAIGAFIYVLK